jgi:hypothetical protein
MAVEKTVKEEDRRQKQAGQQDIDNGAAIIEQLLKIGHGLLR